MAAKVLIAMTRSFARWRPVRILLITTKELPHYLNCGWTLVARDPCPDEHDKDDGA